MSLLKKKKNSQDEWLYCIFILRHDHRISGHEKMFFFQFCRINRFHVTSSILPHRIIHRGCKYIQELQQVLIHRHSILRSRWNGISVLTFYILSKFFLKTKRSF